MLFNGHNLLYLYIYSALLTQWDDCARGWSNQLSLQPPSLDQCSGNGKGFNLTYGDTVCRPGHQHCQLPWWRACSCAWWLRRQGWLNGNMSIAQHIGNFSTGKETPQPLSSHTELDLSLCYTVIAVISFLFLILVILVCGCMCTWCCGLWACRKGCSHSIRVQ